MTPTERLQRIRASLTDAETMLNIARRQANHLREVYPDEFTLARLADALRILADCIDEAQLLAQYANPET